MRGTDAQHHLHVTELGEPGVRRRRPRRRRAPPISTRSPARPAPARSRRSTSPAAGSACGSPIRTASPSRSCTASTRCRAARAAAARAVNTGSDRARLGERQAVERGPAHVKRLGHFVLLVNDFRETEAFYHSHFGFRELRRDLPRRPRAGARRLHALRPRRASTSITTPSSPSARAWSSSTTSPSRCRISTT